jgi:hypothetical protein
MAECKSSAVNNVWWQMADSVEGNVFIVCLPSLDWQLNKPGYVSYAHNLATALQDKRRPHK